MEEGKKFLPGITGHVEKGKLTDYCNTVPLTEKPVLGKLLGMNWWEHIWISGQYSDSAVLEYEGDRLYKKTSLELSYGYFRQLINQHRHCHYFPQRVCLRCKTHTAFTRMQTTLI